MRALQWLAIASLIGLLALGLAWELWLAPLRPGGSWLVLKTVPLLFPLRGMLHGRRYTFQWVSLLSLLYCLEGAARTYADRDAAQALAVAELALALALLAASIGFCRVQRHHGGFTGPASSGTARGDRSS
jgi:uncharacterized membrane protein